MKESKKIAICIPCYNEEKSIGKVIKDFKLAIPQGRIYVYDNCSSDQTLNIAKENGAEVKQVSKKGKGNVVKRMFADIDADFYILVDGDDTYDASISKDIIERLVSNDIDMIVATRKTNNLSGEYRKGHEFGNKLLTSSVSLLFGRGFTDMLSGYRFMNKRFVKSMPLLSSGFEIETEITIHSLQIGATFEEFETEYFSRVDGSESKLNTYRDGLKIAKKIFLMFKDEKPFIFFSILAVLFFVSSIYIFTPVLETYLETGFVPRLPTTVLSSVLMILSFLSLITGLILDTIVNLKKQIKRLEYLRYDI